MDNAAECKSCWDLYVLTRFALCGVVHRLVDACASLHRFLTSRQALPDVQGMIVEDVPSSCIQEYQPSTVHRSQQTQQCAFPNHSQDMLYENSALYHGTHLIPVL